MSLCRWCYGGVCCCESLSSAPCESHWWYVSPPPSVLYGSPLSVLCESLLSVLCESHQCYASLRESPPLALYRSPLSGLHESLLLRVSVVSTV